MWPLIGWIAVCATATYPAAKWGPAPPLFLFPTQAACVASQRYANALIAKLIAEEGPRPQDEGVDLTCWCAGVAQGK